MPRLEWVQRGKLTERDIAMHRLAKELGMTVAELDSRMTLKEFGRWMAFWEHESGHRQTMSEALQEVSKWQL